jgi:L-ornithine N5-oxygenase
MVHIYDVLGIGFGPGNLALAIGFEEMLPGLDVHFIEARATAQWQDGMMIHRANIQHHPSIDLVTPRNPRSRYTFINYLFENDLLFRHFNLSLEYPLRKDYNRYIDWAARQFAHLVEYGKKAVSIDLETIEGQRVYCVRTSTGDEYRCRILVVAPGRTLMVPAPFDTLQSDRVFHLNYYLHRIDSLVREQGVRRVAVIGASQSGVEILIDLASRFPKLEVVSYIRHFGYRLKDTSPFMEASVHPEYVEPFYRASYADKERINTDLRYLNYSSCDMDVLKELNLILYEQHIDGRNQLTVLNNHQIKAAGRDGDGVRITAEHVYQRTTDERTVDAVVLATGFRDLGPGPTQEKLPSLLKSLESQLQFDERGVLHVNFDYSVSARDGQAAIPPLFLNGLCEGSHGISDAGSFSLLSLRAQKLVTAIAAATGRPLFSENRETPR